ncbi:DUF4190 domain-containing protein [Gordonia rhizosphera]|uniref:DUF4190 domain-containing protein n=1 Tax=Gordonia rhizosphera NBRC 16068 TaxID=1108045 RepID=K6WPH2_9ACTN|nr:DUF4190 domain-containing protein [Gordonia rhizosphera]GAB88434.1 hypothetical protein GORHZ_022_00060 [Gordonia rhizosphera NBRC 16068]
MAHPPGEPDRASSDDEWSSLPPASPYDFPGMTAPGPQVPSTGQSPYGPPAPYGQPPYGPAPYVTPMPMGYAVSASRATDGRAVASLICGVLSLVLAFMCLGLAIPVPIVAVMLGVLARRDIAASGGHTAGSGMALAGIVTGAIGTTVSLLFLIFFGMAIANAAEVAPG